MATVLIVDDEPSVRDLIRDTLELEDHVSFPTWWCWTS